MAGSDSSAGAGIQADLKTFAAHGVYGLSAITAIVAEVPGEVASFQAVDPTLLSHQLNRVQSAFPVRAAKTGMLAEASLVETVVCFFRENRDISFVIDPVIRSGSGTPLLNDDGVLALKESFLPLATLVTPNLPEAELLLDFRIRSESEFAASARQLHERYGTDFLVKGGHFGGNGDIVDHAWIGGEAISFPHPRLAVPDLHGTGCTLSAAITARLAIGIDLITAVRGAIDYLAECLRQHYSWPSCEGTIEALNHFPNGVEFKRS
ncbi:MAG TPA: bifunctional hydroxymethylpyrimidine kinase/phosphomethylpyrimidine kinase [Verrucomicrobiales bacterium]|nr:bifunctional hydroxymethylpyrimidine kinase/phosphomethylpyrimidine kinase [Verrucomicrobiales bacterium]